MFINLPSASRYFIQCVLLCSFFWQAFALAEDLSSPLIAQQAIEGKDWQYQVKINDSFAIIQRQYLNQYSDIDKLATYNNHPISKVFKPNQLLRIPVHLLKKQRKPVEVMLVVGDVSVISQGKALDVKANKKPASKQVLVINSQLNEGDVVITGANSIAKLRFFDASVTVIQPNSSIEIAKSYQYTGLGEVVTELALSIGRTEVLANPNRNINSHFQIQTPSAVAAVRGTEFRVGVEGENRQLALQETLEGKVAFSASGSEVLVAQGFGSVAEFGKAPLPPVALPSAPDTTTFERKFEFLPITFALASQQNTVAWMSQLATDADFTNLVADKKVAVIEDQASILAFDDLPDGKYFLKLRAKEVSGLQGKDAIHSFEVAARPLAPNLLAPENNEVIKDANISFNWSLLEDRNKYFLQIAEDINFTNVVLVRVSVAGQLQVNPKDFKSVFRKDVSASETIDAKYAAKPFYWRVSSIHNGKAVKFSKVRSFLY